jgi:nucleoid-associated protein YgaU
MMTWHMAALRSRTYAGGIMGLFEKKDGEPAKADFSDVQSGSSSTAPAPPAVPPDVQRTYVVVKGDSLSKIAKQQYGDASKWHDIYHANADVIKNPDLIYPGQTLRLP